MERDIDERMVRADDEFLTALSRGIDPSEGTDPLATALLDLRDEVEAQMPAAPLLDAAESDADTSDASVASLAERRAAHEGRRARISPWMSGLVGAAAATVVVAGTGAALYNAEPGSALWGPSQAVFGERTDVVEFASALDEIETKTESGDVDGARTLIEQLRKSLAMGRNATERETTQPSSSTAESTADPAPAPAPKPEKEEPATVTVTPEPVTVTVTVTQPAAAPAPAPGTKSTGVEQPAPATPAPSPSAPVPAPAPAAQQ